VNRDFFISVSRLVANNARKLYFCTVSLEGEFTLAIGGAHEC
jgi:hypothetical protein